MRGPRVLEPGLALGGDDAVVRVRCDVRLLLVAGTVEHRRRVRDQLHRRDRGLDLLDELLRRHLFADEDQRVRAVALPVLDEAVELRERGGRVGTADGQGRIGSPLHAEIAQRGRDDRLHAGVVGGDVDDRDLLARERSFLLQQRHDHAQPALRRDVGREHESRRSAVDERLRERAADDDRPVLLREAQLRVAIRVVEGAERCEHLAVVGERRARGQLGREVERAVGLEHRHDLAAVDPALGIDVVEIDLVGALLFRLDRVDELLDAREVDHHHPDLDLGRGDTSAERCVLRDARRRRAGGRSRPCRRALLRTAAARGRDEDHPDQRHPPGPAGGERDVAQREPPIASSRCSGIRRGPSSCRSEAMTSRTAGAGRCRRRRTCPAGATRTDHHPG